MGNAPVPFLVPLPAPRTAKAATLVYFHRVRIVSR